ncbi:procollagen-lysine,2-oxoglutarate 5-dioxygenase 2-like isoform X1 [Penaeus chinensis]|uniref:procollagen-lysine,2-oxoglutarate 5-dioxygenase 2-like isoform X1 n=1 Tax=Penaeus chinensis TaxID=139456 RepID=UPI001FB65BA0|nr:procollagen-lysine,2-oxoglutarate 5-dioxygenase 2-like isoform X1 [Penaeus chinensis]
MLETRRGALVTSVFVAFVCLTTFGNVVTADEEKKGDLVVLTPYRKDSDGLSRFVRSAKLYGYKIKVLGEKAGQEAEPGEEELLSLLKEELKALSEDPEKIVLYTEGASTVLSAGPVRVVEEFERSGAAVLVSADGFCWPDRELEASYPKVKRGKRFLNSGGIVGRAESFFSVLSASAEEKSLQMLLTHAYVKDATRDKYNIRLDHLSNLFQNLNGATGDVELRFAGKEAYLQNTLYNSVPVVVTGNGHTSLVLNTLGSYLARAWNPEEGCRSCWDDMITLDPAKEEEMPAVALGVFVEKETPFLEEFLEKIASQVYPKQRINLFVHNSVKYHEETVSAWAEAMKEEVASVKYTGVEDNVKEWHARNAAVDFCLESESQYYFSVDSEAHIDNPYTIKLLIEQNRDVVAPMLIRPYKAWSNFWGAITSDGFYARSMDYMEIVQGHRRGLWNVPYITSCYLVRRHLLEGDKRPAYIKNLLDPDMAFCENLREKGVFMYVSNRVDFGHLVNADQFDTSRMNPELWQVVDNRWDWEQRYLHPNYSSAVAENATVEMPCSDVYWFPLFKERYAQEMIQTFEDFGVWSEGTNDDPRLEGGYESVPTIDIHMKQIGMETEWLEILRVYVQPMQLKVFEGYYNDVGPPRAIMNFMVRYKPDEQPFLRPHHDTSTYTINVALNKPGVDYKGGGCRFVRYNCSVTDSRVGWILMHPGRLTHLHEGLPTTEGTRYIIVSFVDP